MKGVFALYRSIVGGAINVRREIFGIEGSWGSGQPGSEEVQGACGRGCGRLTSMASIVCSGIRGRRVQREKMAQRRYGKRGIMRRSALEWK